MCYEMRGEYLVVVDEGNPVIIVNVVRDDNIGVAVRDFVGSE